MKRIYNLYFLLVFVAISALWSCNDDFMDKYPLDEITDQNYWHTLNDLELYCNALYPKYIIGFGSGWGSSTVEPYGYTAAAIAYGDVITDNAAGWTYSKVAANQYTDYITGGSGSGGWNFSDIRDLNYFLVNYKRVDVPAAEREVYAGEVLMFKAWDYYKKLKLFGAVPWLNKPLQTNSEELFAPRLPREQVMDSILNILDKAITWLPEKGMEEQGRLNKDIALFLKARICLFGGTYRKYHSELGLDGTALLKECTQACEKLMSSSHYQLYSTGHPNSDYHNLFSQYSYANNKGIILWREYAADQNYGVAFSRYFAQNLREQYGATRSLVDAYLCKDGKPISKSSLFLGHDSIQLEMKNRDPRLPQTIANFGTYNLQKGVMGADNAPVPNIPGMSGNMCPTGYRVAKWFLNDPADWDRVTHGMQASPIFRYAEVLLNYAEAKYELGECTQAVIDKTVNLTRARVGMPPLEINDIPADPALDQMYAKYVGYVPSPLLREIRRERRVEFAIENHRWDDLMRWKAGGFLEVPVEGIKFVPDQFPSVEAGKDVFLSDEGYIMPYKQVLPNGRKWEDKEYLFPIPIEDLVLNPNLKQNPGWQSP